MNISHRLAIISFCNRFTDPKAISVPIACLLVGQDENSQWVAAAVGWTPDAADPISERLLNDVPRLVRSHLEDVFAKPNNEWTTELILHSLHDELRNAVHVSWVGPELTSDVADASVDTIRLAKVGLTEAMTQTIRELRERLDKPTNLLDQTDIFVREPATLMKAVERSSSVQWFPAVMPNSSPAVHP